MSTKRTNENVFRAARKFTDAFFDGVKSGAADRIIQQAKQRGVERDAIEKMERIKQEKDELEQLLQKYPLRPKK